MVLKPYCWGSERVAVGTVVWQQYSRPCQATESFLSQASCMWELVCGSTV